MAIQSSIDDALKVQNFFVGGGTNADGPISGQESENMHLSPRLLLREIVAGLKAISLRALSKGINDPFTAFSCIDWLSVGRSGAI